MASVLLGSNRVILTAADRFADASRGYAALGWTGALVALVSLTNAVISLWGVSREEGEALFAAGVTAFESLPLAAFGAAALTISALGRGDRWYLWLAAAANTMLVMTLVAALQWWSGAAAGALTADLPLVQQESRRTVIRVCVSAASFGALLLFLAQRCAGAARTHARQR